MKRTLAAILLLTAIASAQTSDRVAGRLIDLSCGSMGMRETTDHQHVLAVIHCSPCMKEQRSDFNLAIITHASVIRLTPENIKIAQEWRKDLEFGEVYVYIDKDGKIHRTILPE